MLTRTGICQRFILELYLRLGRRGTDDRCPRCTTSNVASVSLAGHGLVRSSNRVSTNNETTVSLNFVRLTAQVWQIVTVISFEYKMVMVKLE